MRYERAQFFSHLLTKQHFSSINSMLLYIDICIISFCWLFIVYMYICMSVFFFFCVHHHHLLFLSFSSLKHIYDSHCIFRRIYSIDFCIIVIIILFLFIAFTFGGGGGGRSTHMHKHSFVLSVAHSRERMHLTTMQKKGKFAHRSLS